MTSTMGINAQVKRPKLVVVVVKYKMFWEEERRGGEWSLLLPVEDSGKDTK